MLNWSWHRLGWPPMETLARGQYDVAHSPSPMLMPARRAARVITIHDLDFLQHPERARDEVKRDYGPLVRRHATAAEGVIVPSAHVKGLVAELLGLPPERISVCPQGGPGWAPAPGFKPGNPSGRYVLFVGTLEARKNVHGLLDAYAALATRWPEAPLLVLAGRRTEDSDRWLEAASRPPLAGRVDYRGYVPESSKRELYEGAKLLVLPSFDEGFGMPVVEAMSLGVPVVCSDSGALPEVCGGAALLVDANDRGSISQAIERVLVGPELAERLGERGLARAAQFTWERTAAMTREAYAGAVARKARAAA